MRLAIATENDQVSPHFGHCEKFTVVDIENGKVAKREELSCPAHDCGTLPRFLGDNGVQCVIAGGIGGRPLQNFLMIGIQVVPGVAGSIEEVISSILKGSLRGGQNLCGGGDHSGPHECGRHS